MERLSMLNLPILSDLVKHYLRQCSSTSNLYTFQPDFSGLKQALTLKKQSFEHRPLVQKILDYNYQDVDNITAIEKEHIQILKEDGFAIVTAHQPNLFMGPLYTVTKAISAIALADQINKVLGSKKIVPIYVIGSEDHDKEELLNVNLFGNKFEWNTSQTGSVGQMIVDDELLEIVNEWISSFGDLPYAAELKDIYNSAYKSERRIGEAHKALLRSLFSKHGLIILELGQKEVKETMVPIFEKELKENFSYNLLQENTEFLNKNYHIQAPPREINLFEYKNGERVRIDKVDDETIKRLHKQPENFSPNVILRPLMQQTVLPSIAYVGGGSEAAYWLQLKPIFDVSKVDFPVVLVRDIFCPIDEKSWDKWTSNDLKPEYFFLDTDQLKKKIVLKDSNLEVDFKDIENAVLSEFETIGTQLNSIDKTLRKSFEGEKVKLKKSIENLYNKAIKAEKRKQEQTLNSIERIQSKVYSSGLTERRENFSNYYLRYGSAWIDNMIEEANPLDNSLKFQILD